MTFLSNLNSFTNYKISAALGVVGILSGSSLIKKAALITGAASLALHAYQAFTGSAASSSAPPRTQSPSQSSRPPADKPKPAASPIPSSAPPPSQSLTNTVPSAPPRTQSPLPPVIATSPPPTAVSQTDIEILNSFKNSGSLILSVYPSNCNANIVQIFARTKTSLPLPLLFSFTNEALARKEFKGYEAHDYHFKIDNIKSLEIFCNLVYDKEYEGKGAVFNIYLGNNPEFTISAVKIAAPLLKQTNPFENPPPRIHQQPSALGHRSPASPSPSISSTRRKATLEDIPDCGLTIGNIIICKQKPLVEGTSFSIVDNHAPRPSKSQNKTYVNAINTDMELIILLNQIHEHRSKNNLFYIYPNETLSDTRKMHFINQIVKFCSRASG